MKSLHLDRLLEFFTSLQLVVALLWLGLAVFTIFLAILMYSRWGQYKPLRKCMALSLLAHLLLAGYAATVEIVAPLPPPVEHVFHVSIGDGGGGKEKPGGGGVSVAKGKEQPWEVFPNDAVAQPEAADLDRGQTNLLLEPKRLVRAEDAKLPGDPSLDHLALAEVRPPDPKPLAAVESTRPSSSGESAESIDAPAAQRRDAAQPAVPGIAVAGERIATRSVAQPVRTSSDDVPTALLQSLAPLPKMIESADASDPRDVMAEIAGARPNPVRPDPADSTTTGGGVASTAADAAYGGGVGAGGGAGTGGGGTVAGQPGRLAAPSIAGLGVRRPGGGEGGQGSGEFGLGGGTQLASAGTGVGPPGLPRGRHGNSDQPIPDAYKLRVAPNRAGVAQRQGGSAETEAAVKAALKWLVENQAADGHWDARAHGAGKEMNVLGRNRQNAGSRADTGMTGLALLALLASGHTHRDGPYREDVRRGLEYLMQTQAADGNLGGKAASFEFMYCHAMAACALSEAYGMTHDDRLRGTVERAIGYTVAAQDPVGGGWRYKPGDPGDTSQLGWQLMALKSAELAGIPTPVRTRNGAIRYLQSVASGTHGGRASYRPGEQVSRTMSAEALVCWQFLGIPRDHPACNEAGDYLLGELPGDGVYNLYYWYYATLGMYQLQGIHWQRWNDALRKALVSRQVKDGPLAGSWDTNDLWGGHGGRVYTTALAALALEVYYRFLPLYTVVAPEEDRAK
jgi:hypothetical protein